MPNFVTFGSGFWSSDTPNFALLHRNSWSPLQQCNTVILSVAGKLLLFFLFFVQMATLCTDQCKTRQGLLSAHPCTAKFTLTGAKVGVSVYLCVCVCVSVGNVCKPCKNG